MRDVHAAMFGRIAWWMKGLPRSWRSPGKCWKGTLLAGAREYKSDFACRHYMRGKVEGMAHGLLMVLAVREIEVPESVRVRVGATTDLELLELWVRRAATVQSADELFDPR